MREKYCKQYTMYRILYPSLERCTAYLTYLLNKKVDSSRLRVLGKGLFCVHTVARNTDLRMNASLKHPILAVLRKRMRSRDFYAMRNTQRSEAFQGVHRKCVRLVYAEGFATILAIHFSQESGYVHVHSHTGTSRDMLPTSPPRPKGVFR